MTIKDLISQGRTIQKGLKYIPPVGGMLRTFKVYAPSDIDAYYNWKECTIRFLHQYCPIEVERFIKYSDAFEENHYLPRYLSNMVGVLEACDSFPSQQMEHVKVSDEREKEIYQVESLEMAYVSLTDESTAHNSIRAFHDWHAAACVLFDKWIYPMDDDWMKFQDIKGNGNGYELKHEFDMIYSSYKKLMSRLKEGRNIKGSPQSPKVSQTKHTNKDTNKINIFISYAHEDEKWLDRLKKHLKVLARHSDNVEYWEDTKLRGGDKWREEITKAIEKANVAILLVSTDFLVSDFISSDELPPILRKAVEEGTRVLPLIVSPCSFEYSELNDFQAINSPEMTLADMSSDEAAVERVFLSLIKEIQALV